jgi:hypothetical protein
VTVTGTPGSPGRRDEGRALIEVVFLAVLLLIPVVYILASVLRLQSATLAVAQAARDVGRLIETAPDTTALGSAGDVARVALQDQNVSPDRLRLRTVAPGADCRQAPEVDATLRPGASYDVCVIAVITLPGVPTVLSGSDNTVTGVYSVHIGELREGR